MPRILGRAAGPLRGSLAVPGDKSISHRAALFGLIASAPCRAGGWLRSADTLSSLAAVRALGGRAELDGDTLTIEPPAEWASPERIDCGNSGTTVRLLMGLLAGRLPAGGRGVVLHGDASLSARPMGRVIEPLRAMGADIECLELEGRLPVRIRGARLRGLRHDLPVPSAQVKSALLLAGLAADGTTHVFGGGNSRDHTERLLAVMGVPCRRIPGSDGLEVAGGGRPGAYDLAVPGDPSSAAFPLCAAAMVPGSRLTVRGHSLNEGRTGALEVLRRCGAKVTIAPDPVPEGGEPLGAVTVEPGALRPFTIPAEEIPALVDEIPVLAVLATQIPGTSCITGAAELRVKESDRLAMIARGLGALGADIQETADGLVVTGPANLRGGPPGEPLVLETAADHRIAMALAVAALGAEGECALDDEACVAISYPDFFEMLDRLLGGH